MIDDLALTCLELVAQDTTRFSRIQLRTHVTKIDVSPKYGVLDCE